MAYEGSRRGRRGTFSVEAAIILIAFVVIASALAFAVMNMGYYAAQKTKETMEKGVQEVSSALELDGSITAYVNCTDDDESDNEPRVQYLIIPVKTCVARSPVDLSNGSFIVTVTLSNMTLPNIYNGTLKEIEYTDPIKTLDTETLEGIFENQRNSTALAFILTGDGDNVLELNEKAFIIIRLAEYWTEDSEGTEYNIIGPTSYEMIKIDLRSGEGATLSLSRQIPPGLPDSGFVDLG